jgi:S1-C subfamily serine protease
MVVSLIEQHQPASRSELRVGDRILDLNGAVVRNLEELRSGIATAGKAMGVVNLSIERDGRQLEIEIKLDSPSDVDL